MKEEAKIRITDFTSKEEIEIPLVERPTWDGYFARIVKDVALRATCTRRKFGAIVVDDRCHIVSTGFNGVVRGAPHCLDVGCIKDELNIESGMGHGICPAVHAEMNALLQAGKKAKDSTLYVNAYPCKICARLIVNAEIERVVLSGTYTDEEGLQILKEHNIEMVEISK